MGDASEITRANASRIIVWAALSALLLGYVRWGSEVVSITSFYHVRRSVPSIWRAFRRGLPDVASGTAMNVVYAVSLGILLVGVLALVWLALDPAEDDAVPAHEEPR